MTISKNDFIFRLRVLFGSDGTTQSVEVVNKTELVENGTVLSQVDSSVRNVDPQNPAIKSAVAALLAAFSTAYEAEEAARVAEEKAKQEAAEKAQAEADARAAAAAAPAEGA